jgi:hypothetical protein
MNDPEEITLLRVHPRPSEPVTLSIPPDTLGMIREVAETRDMSPEALMKLYIGHGLRQDWAIHAGASHARRPNATTLRALNDAHARDGLTSHASPDELFDDLGI